MSARNTFSTPLDVSLYKGPSNDPFVPNNSYREHVRKTSSARTNMLPNVYIVDDEVCTVMNFGLFLLAVGFYHVFS